MSSVSGSFSLQSLIPNDWLVGVLLICLTFAKKFGADASNYDKLVLLTVVIVFIMVGFLFQGERRDPGADVMAVCPPDTGRKFNPALVAVAIALCLIAARYNQVQSQDNYNREWAPIVAFATSFALLFLYLYRRWEFGNRSTLDRLTESARNNPKTMSILAFTFFLVFACFSCGGTSSAESPSSCCPIYDSLLNILREQMSI